MSNSTAYLHFQDGQHFKGEIINLKKVSSSDNWIGEAAFTTGMSGYQETITDPSFLGQHIIFTSAEIANYDASEYLNQSNCSHAASIITKNITINKFIKELNIPVITNVDTRSLVRYLTQKNTSNHKCIITLSSNSPEQIMFKQDNLECNNLSRVSVSKQTTIIEGTKPIVIIDYGVKTAIINYLKELNQPMVIVPSNTSCSKILELNPKMLFLTNGPGDPRKYIEQIKTVKDLLKSNIPMRGICLGHQLLSIALGFQVKKLPYGQRGTNHPVFDHINNSVRITSQNHGYAVSSIDNNKNIFIEYTSLFDKSIEGISSFDRLYRSVQFHPEAHPGPFDNLDFFSEIKEYLGHGNKNKVLNQESLYPFPTYDRKEKLPYKNILLIGSGPIRIGQASEFDYSGTQACKALSKLGLNVILLNSNPATIMTDPEIAYKTYIEPICKETIKKIIEKENIDSLISTMGGQTALNFSLELAKEGYLKKKNVELLGANIETIEKTEDRQLFAIELEKLGYKTGKRFSSNTKEEAISLATDKVNFPLIIRRDFALGGKGALLITSAFELEEILTKEISFPITMEKSLLGWKEIELEVMVDKDKNGVVICSIENIDPCGIHTGDSITVAPAQTFSDQCLQKLRTMSLTIAKHMNVVAGGANVQFAVNPKDENDIIVIEMNPRVSRSSALASKATGYPIAKISAQLAVGITLKEILNDITKSSPVCFEPTLDYVAVKIPLFTFHKFPLSSEILGPQMRSIGEVLALGGSFNEAFLKALRSLECGLEIPSLNQLKNIPLVLDDQFLKERLSKQKQMSLVTVIDSLRNNIPVEEVQKISSISKWFIDQMKIIVDLENKINKTDISDIELICKLKQNGFSDKHIAYFAELSQEEIFKLRFNNNLKPVFKAVDTCSAEFVAQTPYFYSTYSQENEATTMNNDENYIILGSGPNRIGQGIEFDYSCVKSAQEIRKQNKKAILINSNPETVSTDYDSSDRLYIASLYSEELFDIIENESPKGIITSFSGQSGIKIRSILENGFRSKYQNFNFLGSNLDTIDLTEDRKRFADVVAGTQLSQTNSLEVRGYKQLINAILEIGFPVIIRPSYVIGGESMFIFYSIKDIETLPESSQLLIKDPSVTFQVENYLENATEYDVDLIRDSFGNTQFSICEHIEHAGVHSGDSGMVTPPIAITKTTLNKMIDISNNLAKKLKIIGVVNIQYAVKNEEIFCIEANPRGSRTLPFLSKAIKKSLPGLATKAMLGQEIKNSTTLPKIYSVKQSTFPFDRFLNDDIILGPKMRSTGETMSIDIDFHQAILKSYLGNYLDIEKPGKILISLADKSKEILKPYLKQLSKIGYQFYATKGSSDYINNLNINCKTLSRIEEKSNTILDILPEDDMRMVFNIPQSFSSSKTDGEILRNTSISYNIPCFTRKENIVSVIESIINYHLVNDKTLEIYNLQDSI